MCLYWAIRKLSERESGNFPVFSGLSSTKLNTKSVETGYFVTYTSTSWDKSVAKDFIGGDKGMLIQIDPNYKGSFGVNCCDVSWISKFPDECEVLFSRSTDNYGDRYSDFKCIVIDESEGIQTVLLKK